MSALRQRVFPAPVRQDPPARQNPLPASPPIIRSDDLFHGETEVLIAHANAIYRLKITRQGKLILNK